MLYSLSQRINVGHEIKMLLWQFRKYCIKKKIHLYGQFIHILNTLGYFPKNGSSIINFGLVRAVTNVKYITKQLTRIPDL